MTATSKLFERRQSAYQSQHLQTGSFRCPELIEIGAGAVDSHTGGSARQIGLPRICVIRLCRRRKRCFGPHVVCLHHHRELAIARRARALERLARQGKP